MVTIPQTVRQLRTLRDQTQRELQNLDLAIKALAQVGNSSGAARPKSKRTMSPEARRKIAAFQKARWAKIRAAANK
jgi:hypothetical protein